jgi:hypothetical protein
MKFKKYAVLLFIITFIVGSQLLLSQKNETRAGQSFHSSSELKYFQNQIHVPIDSNDYFLHSIVCKGCHGFDTLGTASVDINGVDINLYDDWEATMMANSAIDPLWRAKVSHEILVDPGHALQLQNKCTSCHAPMGHFTAIYKGFSNYTIAMLDTDSLGLNGVACGGCHEIGTNNLGSVFSGNIPYDTSKVEFGPFTAPVAGPMQLYVGLTPTYSPHISEGRFCSPCHTLITNTVDLNGNLTGGTFVEQATFHEWENSSSPGDNVTCQKCHMPQTLDSIIIASGILNLPPRAPFNKHKFAGANTFMVQLIKDNKTALGLTTADVRFDSTLAAITRLLQQNTLGVKILMDSLIGDTAFVNVRLINKAGHKFPSGYPSRRAVVQLIALDQSNDTVFKSGIFDPDYEVVGIDTTFEPHYNVITNESQTEIYEMVMGDVNNNKTTVLERADTILKDNRLVPEGFVTTSPVYDTVQIVGDAVSDPDFNKTPGGIEGTGRDNVHYHIPLAGFSGTIRVFARVFYQTVPPGWLKEMFTYTSAPIDSFRNMYQAADRTPFLIGADSLNIASVGSSETALNDGFDIYPNPSTDGRIRISSRGTLKIQKIDVYSMNSKLMKDFTFEVKRSSVILDMSDSKGIYLISIDTGSKRIIKKIVLE